MYINPHRAIQEGWVKFPEWMDEEFRQKCIQPNAIDITLDRVFELMHYESFSLSESEKKLRTTIERFPTVVTPNSMTEGEYFSISHGYVDAMSDFFVDIPEGIAAFIIVRSTLNRNGLFVTSGLYDQGFKNKVGFMIRNQGPNAYIAPHTRVAQLVFVKAEDSGILYNGTYNKNEGEHWSTIKEDSDIDTERLFGVQEMTAPQGTIFKMDIPSDVQVEQTENRKVFSVDVPDDMPIEQVQQVVKTATTKVKGTSKPKQGE